jgi:translocation and assembly module TamA
MQASAQETDPELKALIPDAAVADPEGWAKAPPPVALPEGPQPEPNSPLAQDSQFRLPWPDEPFELPPLLALEPDPDQVAALAAQANEPVVMRDSGAVLQVSPQLALVFPTDPASFVDRDGFTQRFAALSNTQRLSNASEDNAAQLAARARTDGDLLRRLLRIYGYYDATVEQTITGLEAGNASARPTISFRITPGPRFRFGTVALGDLERTGKDYPWLRSAFGIQTGDPLDSDRIVAGQSALDSALGEAGYAFAKLGEPDLVIDHRAEAGDLSLPVTTGGAYTFGSVTSNLADFLPGKHLERIARFKRGDLYKRSQSEDLRRAIIATGLVSSVGITPREVVPPRGDLPGSVALDVTLAKAPLRTIAAKASASKPAGNTATCSRPKGCCGCAGCWAPRSSWPASPFAAAIFADAIRC